MDKIKTNIEGSSFSFWGSSGLLELRDDLPQVMLRYETEPPHGDFLYSISIDGATLTEKRKVRLFWGRNLLLSMCRRYLAATEYRKDISGCYSVFDLDRRQEWRQSGWVHLERLVFPTLVIRPWITSGMNVTYGEAESILLDDKSAWTSIKATRGIPNDTISW